MLKKKFLGVLCSIALIMTLIPATVAAAAEPITTDVVIHKLVVAAGTSEAAHDGEEIDELTGNLAGATPLAGVTFRYWSIADTATAAQMAQLLGLETVAAVEAWMAINTGILTAGGTTGATDAQGVTGVTGMVEGKYLFVEIPGAVSVGDFIGVPFLLELPAMKVDGTGYFGTGTNALHVYPKNVLATPGLDVETVDGDDNQVGPSGFDLEKKNPDGSWSKIADIDLPGGFKTIEDLPSGDYRLINTDVPDGFVKDSEPIEFTVDDGNVSLPGTGIGNPRADFTPATDSDNAIISLTLDETPVPDKTTDGVKEKSYAIGDTVPWTVTAPIPDSIDTYLTYTITDTLDSALSWLGDGNVMVMDGATPVDTAAYTVAISGQTLTITFDPELMTGYAGKSLTITYDTYINDSAVMGEDINNDVTINFDNGRGGTGQIKPEDPPSVWTGGKKWQKVDGSDNDTKLAGARFKIAINEGGTQFLTWTQELIEANTAGTFVTPVVGEDIIMESAAGTGLFEIRGLAGGTYYLVEVKAPNDGGTQYNLARDPQSFEVTKTSYEVENIQLFENNSGLQIPKTGGIGTVIFTVVGLSLMTLALFMFRRKKDKTEA